MSTQNIQERLRAEIKELQIQLEEANGTIKHIQSGKDLSVSQDHLILLANHIPQITWTNLPSGQFNFFNERWYDYTGLSFDATFQKSWDQIIHPDDLLITTEKFNSCMKTG